MENEKKNERVIPFDGHVRIGNFKLWKVMNEGVNAFMVSDLEGSWRVKIPETYLSYAMIEQAYKDGEEEYLHTVLANMNFVTAISNGFYQRGVALVGHAYLQPEILREGYKPEQGPSHDDLLTETKHLCEEFLKWYDNAMKEERERGMKENEETIMEQDETAEKALDIVTGSEE